MKYYLGIDGGGTKTTAILCDENAHLISRFVGESINYNSVGMETARENLRQTVDGVLAENDIKLNAAFIGMSAISDRADDNFTRKFCAGIIDCDKVTMDSDVYIGLEAMRCDGAAAMVISGTGSMAVGRLPDEKIIHTGGWGYILGDEGSGYSMSVDALRAAICGYEGRAEKTSLICRNHLCHAPVACAQCAQHSAGMAAKCAVCCSKGRFAAGRCHCCASSGKQRAG